MFDHPRREITELSAIAGEPELFVILCFDPDLLRSNPMRGETAQWCPKNLPVGQFVALTSRVSKCFSSEILMPTCHKCDVRRLGGKTFMNVSVIPSPIVFSTDGMSRSSRLDAWNAAFGSLNEITGLFGENTRNVRCEYWLLGGGVVLSSTRVVPSRFVRDRARCRKNQVDHWVLRVLRSGRGQLRHPSFEATTLPGELVLFSMDESWTVDWADSEWVSLCIPRDLDPRLSTGLTALGSGLLRGQRAGLLADLLLALPARLAATSTEQHPILAGALHGIVSACLLTGGNSPGVVRTKDATNGSARERVRRVILRNISSTRLKPADLAEAAGLSRSSLYRLFETDGGVAHYVRKVRLTLAHDALCDRAEGNRTIGAIGEAHGFPEPADFSRAFRAMYGVSPSGARITGLRADVPLTRVMQQRRRTTARDLAERLYLTADGTI